MNAFTVISRADRDGLYPLAAIAGQVEVGGMFNLTTGLHTAQLYADSADKAVAKVSAAARIVGAIPHLPIRHDPAGDRWTVIGTADTGSLPAWRVEAVVAGEHEVLGRFESMLQHRWVHVVDAPDADAARAAAWKWAEEAYGEDW